MTRILMLVAALGACSSDAADKVDRTYFDAKVRDLERKLDVLEARINAPTEDTTWTHKQTIERFGEISGDLGRHEDRLARVQSLLRIASLDAPHIGWWCGLFCGRTREECVSYELRTIALSGPDRDGSACLRQKTAWCKPGDTLGQCEPARCAGCVETE